MKRTFQPSKAKRFGLFVMAFLLLAALAGGSASAQEAYQLPPLVPVSSAAPTPYPLPPLIPVPSAEPTPYHLPQLIGV